MRPRLPAVHRTLSPWCGYGRRPAPGVCHAGPVHLSSTWLVSQALSARLLREDLESGCGSRSPQPIAGVREPSVEFAGVRSNAAAVMGQVESASPETTTERRQTD